MGNGEEGRREMVMMKEIGKLLRKTVGWSLFAPVAGEHIIPSQVL